MATKSVFSILVAALAILTMQRTARADPTNTVVGVGAGVVLSTGTSNSAVGYNALNKTTTGSENTALGRGALFYNKTGAANTGVGFTALYNGTATYQNTAVGDSALHQNNASDNTALGAYALYGNSSGSENTAVGMSALEYNTSGSDNVAVGVSALYNATGSYNVAVGYDALQNYVNGTSNTAVGTFAASGSSDFTNTGAFGYDATPTANNMFVLGNAWTSVTGGYTTWAVLSDARFKTKVTENVPGLPFILKLRPVTYNWDMKKLVAFEGTKAPAPGTADKQQRRYTGFLAQEVERAAKETGFDFSGVIAPANERSKYMLSYSEFVVPLVKAVQEQQREIEQLRKTVDSLKSEKVASAGVGPLHAAMLANPSSASLALIALLGVVLFARKKESVGRGAQARDHS